jgi:hypothetical protein
MIGTLKAAARNGEPGKKELVAANLGGPVQS